MLNFYHLNLNVLIEGKTGTGKEPAIFMPLVTGRNILL